MIPQSIINAVEILYRQGLRRAVISPGSRSAPLTIAFARHPGIDCLVIPDERAAAFIALGLSQASNLPVVIVSTSGTATLNLAPALAEAYYRHISLIAFTADRPPEWIGQMEGQTINQSDIFKNYTLASYSLPVNDVHPDAQWHCNRIISEAINKSKGPTTGPVHINIPIREPFYPDPNEQLKPDDSLNIIRNSTSSRCLPAEELTIYINKLTSFKKVVIIAGQHQPDKALNEVIKKISHSYQIPVIGEIISNMATNIRRFELIVSQDINPLKLKPDLLITFGGSIISKKLKSFIRNNKPEQHWHITEYDYAPDTYQSLTDILITSPLAFFQKFVVQSPKTKPEQTDFYKLWQNRENGANNLLRSFIDKQPFCDWTAINTVMSNIPEQTVLHLANSMSVRYADLNSSFSNTDKLDVYSNRGTSGIDGCISTAVGHAIADNRPQVLITGDMAFFYDRNALWHKHIPSNLRIIIINNGGGGIFRLIDGPANQPELETYFEAGQSLTAERTAVDYGLSYSSCASINCLRQELAKLFNSINAPHILEVFTDSKTNQIVFNNFQKRNKK